MAIRDQNLSISEVKCNLTEFLCDAESRYLGVVNY
jgi:hypothetical protein